MICWNLPFLFCFDLTWVFCKLLKFADLGVFRFGLPMSLYPFTLFFYSLWGFGELWLICWSSLIWVLLFLDFWFPLSFPFNNKKGRRRVLFFFSPMKRVLFPLNGWFDWCNCNNGVTRKHYFRWGNVCLMGHFFSPTNIMYILGLLLIYLFWMVILGLRLMIEIVHMWMENTHLPLTV